MRLDPTDSDASLWLARLYRMQNDADKAEAVLRTLLKREPENENGVEQLAQLLLDEGKAQDAIQAVLPMTERAPLRPACGDILGSAYFRRRTWPRPKRPTANPSKPSLTISITVRPGADTFKR